MDVADTTTSSTWYSTNPVQPCTYLLDFHCHKNLASYLLSLLWHRTAVLPGQVDVGVGGAGLAMFVACMLMCYTCGTLLRLMTAADGDNDIIIPCF